jgi:hypothetical protein
MKRTALTLLIGGAALALLAAADGPSALHFPLHGVSINALEAPSNGSPSMLLTMCLPVTDAFAPNVSVMDEPSPGSIDDYIASSRKEYAKTNLTIIAINKLDGDNVTLEYTGPVDNRTLHFYSKASHRGTEIVIATGICTAKQWPDVGAKLRGCVDSLQRDPQ